MARYGDLDALEKKLFPIGMVDDGRYALPAKAVKVAIDNLPTADVAPKSEIAREIFADLETKAPWFCENQTAYEHFNEELAELKKKYIGEQK